SCQQIRIASASQSRLVRVLGTVSGDAVDVGDQAEGAAARGGDGDAGTTGHGVRIDRYATPVCRIRPADRRHTRPGHWGWQFIAEEKRTDGSCIASIVDCVLVG